MIGNIQKFRTPQFPELVQVSGKITCTRKIKDIGYNVYDVDGKPYKVRVWWEVKDENGGIWEFKRKKEALKKFYSLKQK